MSEHIICADCPVCGQPIPIVRITVLTTGVWRKYVECDVEGDATDYIAHMWTHP